MELIHAFDRLTLEKYFKSTCFIRDNIRSGKYEETFVKRAAKAKHRLKLLKRNRKHIQKCYTKPEGFSFKFDSQGRPRRKAAIRTLRNNQVRLHVVAAPHRDPIVQQQQLHTNKEFIKYSSSMTLSDLKDDPSKWREDNPNYNEELEMGDAVVDSDDQQDKATELDKSVIEADYESCDEEWEPSCDEVKSGKIKVFPSALDVELKIICQREQDHMNLQEQLQEQLEAMRRENEELRRQLLAKV